MRDKNHINVKLMFIPLLFSVLLTGCSRNAKIEGTYIHHADDTFGELVIVHDGNNVSVTVDGKEYEAKMVDENVISTDPTDKKNNYGPDHLIHETYADDNGNPDINNIHKDLITIPNAKDWIDGDYEVNQRGHLELVLEKE